MIPIPGGSRGPEMGAGAAPDAGAAEEGEGIEVVVLEVVRARAVGADEERAETGGDDARSKKG